MAQSVNEAAIDWLEQQKHPVAICVVWTKEDADKQQEDQGLQPLTDDQWDTVLRRLEKGSGTLEALFDPHREYFNSCIEEALVA